MRWSSVCDGASEDPRGLYVSRAGMPAVWLVRSHHATHKLDHWRAAFSAEDHLSVTKIRVAFIMPKIRPADASAAAHRTALDCLQQGLKAERSDDLQRALHHYADAAIQ